MRIFWHFGNWNTVPLVPVGPPRDRGVIARLFRMFRFRRQVAREYLVELVTLVALERRLPIEPDLLGGHPEAPELAGEGVLREAFPIVPVPPAVALERVEPRRQIGRPETVDAPGVEDGSDVREELDPHARGGARATQLLCRLDQALVPVATHDEPDGDQRLPHLFGPLIQEVERRHFTVAELLKVVITPAAGLAP